MPKCVTILSFSFKVDLLFKLHNKWCHMFYLGHKITAQLIQVVSGAVFVWFYWFSDKHKYRPAIASHIRTNYVPVGTL